MVRVAPERLRGRIWYFRVVSADYVERLRFQEGSPLLSGAVWAALRDTCAQPTVFVFRANDRDRRAAMTDLPLLYEDGRYAAYGPCRSIPGRG